MHIPRPSRPKALALAIMLAGTSVPVLAQELEEIIVTGSLIRGTPEDANLPVEVFTMDDLREVGNPTALEFVKSLTASGPTTGEAYYFSGSGLTSNVGYNLRGIGSDKTLTLFNGRRGGENSSIFPSSAISRIEILKDGAAVTYGADATGGVVNMITRENFEGFELSSSFKDYDGSDGQWNVSAVGGWTWGDTNIMIAGEWDHRSEVDALDRKFSSLPNEVNPAPWSTLTNLSSWTPRGELPAVPGNTATSEWGPALSAFWSGATSDFTQDSCEAVGGVYANAYTCKYDYIPYYNIVEENEFYRLYGQVITQLDENNEFFLRANFARNFSPHQYGSPSQPLVRGPARAAGVLDQIYVPAANPGVAEFAARTGWDQNPLYASTEGYTPFTHRSFAHGGNDLFAEGDSHSTPNLNQTNYVHISTGMNGTFDAWDNEIGYDAAITYNTSKSTNTAPDIMGRRLQEAVMGFGGPNCNAPDLDPARYGTQNPGAAGVGDCGWYNPFASNFAGQPMLGLSNPSYDASLANDPSVSAWLFNERRSENLSSNITLDLSFSGALPLELPGGAIGWGAGVQWRDTRFHDNVPDPIYNGGNPCAWEEQLPVPPDDPTYSGCLPDLPGPFFFFGINDIDRTEQEQSSYFVEFNFPVLDSLFFTAAARNESFTGDLDATVYKVSGKWDVTDNFSLRGSYGDNYQAPSAFIVPGNVGNGVNSYTIAAGNWRGAQTITESGIVPETATVWSAGAIWQSRGFREDHDLRIILDYWDIETEDELGLLASANTIANAVFSIAPDGGSNIPTDGSALADCSHPLIGRVSLNGLACIQGVTSADNFSSISTAFGNGPGQHTAGYDIAVDYSFSAFDGEIRLGVSASIVDTFEFSETTLDGYLLDPGDDRLGTLNFATIANAAPEERINLNANYSRGDHNLRLVLNYTSGVDDERYINDDGSVNVAGLVPSGRPTGGTGANPPSYYGVFGDDWLSTDLHYIWDWEFATLSFSVVNLLDEDPPDSRQEMGYDPRIGNPLGRQLEVGFRKTF